MTERRQRYDEPKSGLVRSDRRGPHASLKVRLRQPVRRRGGGHRLGLRKQPFCQLAARGVTHPNPDDGRHAGPKTAFGGNQLKRRDPRLCQNVRRWPTRQSMPYYRSQQGRRTRANNRRRRHDHDQPDRTAGSGDDTGDRHAAAARDPRDRHHALGLAKLSATTPSVNEKGYPHYFVRAPRILVDRPPVNR
jgi:hypothetical protein